MVSPAIMMNRVMIILIIVGGMTTLFAGLFEVDLLIGFFGERPDYIKVTQVLIGMSTIWLGINLIKN